MLHVLGWLYEDTDGTPAMLLASHGNRLAASRVRATANLTLNKRTACTTVPAAPWRSLTNPPTPHG